MAAALGGVLAMLTPAAVGSAAGRAAAANPSDTLLASVQSEQAAVIDADYRPAVGAAESALAAMNGEAATDRFNLTGDTTALGTANQVVATDAGRLGADTAALAAAARANVVAQNRLAADRVRLKALAIEMYTGGADGVLLSNQATLSGSQISMFGQSEVSLVIGVVVHDLHSDVAAARRDAGTLIRTTRTVASDQRTLASDRLTAARTAAQVAADRISLAAADQAVAARSRHLAQELAAETHATKAIAGPQSAAGGLSVLGPSALTAAQLVAWYSWSGYADLTPATIDQLAGWYLQVGGQLGVRGDVAFAQATLETGGFSSPDAVNLNNYAGIGHCDSCAAGWAFPSPQGGVVGQLELLRIFADPGPPSTQPAPVLPVLVPAKEPKHGCCGTWESLTGVWATDPSYGSKVLSIYQQMLQFTLDGAPQAAAVPAPATGT